MVPPPPENSLYNILFASLQLAAFLFCFCFWMWTNGARRPFHCHKFTSGKRQQSPFQHLCLQDNEYQTYEEGGGFEQEVAPEEENLGDEQEEAAEVSQVFEKQTVQYIGTLPFDFKVIIFLNEKLLNVALIPLNQKQIINVVFICPTRLKMKYYLKNYQRRNLMTTRKKMETLVVSASSRRERMPLSCAWLTRATSEGTSRKHSVGKVCF